MPLLPSVTPIPPAERKDDCWTYVSKELSCKANTLWTAFVEPILTSTTDLTELNKFLSKLITVVAAAETVVSYADLITALLSAPSGWDGVINLWIPVPTDVVPNPTILDFNWTSFAVSFV